MNRILTLNEVAALPEDTLVFVEFSDEAIIHTMAKQSTMLVEEHVPFNFGFNIDLESEEAREDYNCYWRARLYSPDTDECRQPFRGDRYV